MGRGNEGLLEAEGIDLNRENDRDIEAGGNMTVEPVQ